MSRILLIDDDSELRELLAMCLELENFEVIQAGDGAEGIAKLDDAGVDLIIVDLMMPVLDGMRFLAWLQELADDRPPVVVLSAAGRSDMENEALEAGARSVMRKPVTPADLLAKVQEMLG